MLARTNDQNQKPCGSLFSKILMIVYINSFMIPYSFKLGYEVK